VMGLGVLRGRYGDHPFQYNLRFLDVYVHRDSTWQLSVAHVTELRDSLQAPESGRRAE
jgi:hypothetical protein